MKKAPRKTKLSQKIGVNQAPFSLEAPNISDTLQTITFSAQLPTEPSQASLDRLIHDLRSAANAFTFLVDQLASEKDHMNEERHHRKVTQLRQHDAVNRNCIDTIIKCLERQITQA